MRPDQQIQINSLLLDREELFVRIHDIEQAAAAGWVLSESSAAADAQARRFVLGTQAQKRAARLAAAVQRREAKPSGEPERGTTS
jgi:hypothetical protein